MESDGTRGWLLKSLGVLAMDTLTFTSNGGVGDTNTAHMRISMCRRLKASLVVGLVGTLVYAEVQGESHQHADYIVPSTANTLLASGGQVGNVSASVVAYTYTPSPVTLEQLLPRDRLVIKVSALAPPMAKEARLPATGANPFFEHRQRVPRLRAVSPRVAPFWCNSFQKFHGRIWV